MQLITTQFDLDKFCAQLALEDKDGFITVDTEFIRETTYWPNLCLIQVAGSQRDAIIDPLVVDLDLSPLKEIFQAAGIMKVFHAGRQDLEIFYQKFSCLPDPIFDTQIAAMVCGFGESISYENLVKSLLKGNIDKSARYTDWSLRPLSLKQLQYALDDVVYLRKIYEALKHTLETEGRTQWIEEEMMILSSPQTYQTDVHQSWRRLRLLKSTPAYLVRLQALARYREQEAQRRNKPRGRLVKDDVLSYAALSERLTLPELKSLCDRFQKGLSEDFLNGLLAAVQEAVKTSPDTWPHLNLRAHNYAGSSYVVDVMKILLKVKAHEARVAEKLIATTDDLEKLALYGEDSKVLCLQGWRRDLFGEIVLDFLNGKQSIACLGKKLTLLPQS